MKLLPVIALLMAFGLASGYIEIQDDANKVLSLGNDVINHPVEISYRNPIGGYRDPDQYSSPPRENDIIYPDSNGSETSEGEAGNEMDVERLLHVRNSSMSFITNSEIQGIGGFNVRKTFHDNNGLDLKETSSAQNGTLNNANLMLFQSLTAEYNISSSSEENSTRIFLNGTIPTTVFSRSNSRFIGRSYREENIYSNRGDLIRDSYIAGAIKKNATYFSGLNDIYIFANATGEQLLKRTYVNRSTIYVHDARFEGINSFGLDSANRDVSISQDYAGQIAISSRMKWDDYFYPQYENYSIMGCCF